MNRDPKHGSNTRWEKLGQRTPYLTLCAVVGTLLRQEISADFVLACVEKYTVLTLLCKPRPQPCTHFSCDESSCALQAVTLLGGCSFLCGLLLCKAMDPAAGCFSSPPPCSRCSVTQQWRQRLMLCPDCGPRVLLLPLQAQTAAPHTQRLSRLDSVRLPW